MSEPSEPPVPPSPLPPAYAPAPPSGPPPGTATVRISDWFNQAWALIKPYWLEYVLAILLAHLVIFVSELLCFLPILLVIGPMMGGIFIYLAKRIVGVPAQVPDIFKGFQRFKDTTILGLALFLVPLIFTAILFTPTVLGALGAGSGGRMGQAFANVTGCLGCMTVPLSIIVLLVYPVLAGTYLVFALPLVMFKQMDAITAIKRSIEIVKPQTANFLMLLLANMVLLLAANFVGGVLLCVGALILSPLAVSIVGTMQLLAFGDFVGLTREDLAPYAD
ncbi:MAG: hypothetical protein WAM82_25940 [Thermoanaerobaculia bacterium]